MVARLIEGWEQSTATADYVGRWVFAAGTPTIGPLYGRYGNGLRHSSSGALTTKTLDAQATWVMGMAVLVDTTNAVGSNPTGVLSVATDATVQATLALNPAWTLSVCRSTATGTVLGTTASAVPLDTWFYLEWRITIGNTGSTIVRVNDAEVLNLPSIDTQQHATTASANQIRLGPLAVGTTSAISYDDLYVFDTTGSSNTAFIGDCRVERLLPTGAGATTAWTPSAGSNYACVDEVPPNADTDYVSSATAGQTDTYAFGNLVTTSGTVFAVQAGATARKDDAGGRTLALVARPGGTDRVGATQGVGDTYNGFTQVWDVNPDTTAAWTIPEVNAAVFGLRLVS